MFRQVCTVIAPRVATASRSRAAPLASLLARSNGPHLVRGAGGGNALEFVVASSSAHRCSWRRTLSSSSNAKMAGVGEERQGEDGEGMGSGRDSRDPKTGEGIWIDDEDEPLVLEKPKKVQKFCGKVISDNMDKTIKVAVPYWYYVKGLGRRIVRHSKIMAHDEENACNIGDRVILVDCKRKSKRKNHVLYEIVHKLPKLDD